MVGAWCRLDKPNGVIIAQGGESLGYALSIEQGAVSWCIREQGVLYKMTAGQVTLDEWTHVAAHIDPKGQGQILINGQRVGEPKELSLLSARPADGLDVGIDGGSQVGGETSMPPLSGELRDVRVYWGVLPEKNWVEWAN